jgi:hypothetical protein
VLQGDCVIGTIQNDSIDVNPEIWPVGCTKKRLLTPKYCPLAKYATGTIKRSRKAALTAHLK